MSRRLILWVIDEQHLAEQKVSEASVKRHMPDVDTKCFVVKKQVTWYDVFIKKLQETLSIGYDYYLFFDSEIYLTEPVYDIFEVLEKYDIVSTHAPARQTTNMPEDKYVPAAYPEFNTGVLGYANTSQVWHLFDWWLEEYYDMLAISGDNDQSALRAAMWKQGTHAWVLPPEYNARLGFGMFAAGRIKILHLRYPDAPIEKVAEWANTQGGMRLLSSKDLPKER